MKVKLKASGVVKGGNILEGAHNAGNDAIAHLKILVCFILNSLLDGNNDYYD